MNFYNTDFGPYKPLAFELLVLWMILVAFGTLPLMTYIMTLKQSKNKRLQKIGSLIYWVLFPAFVAVSGIAIMAWNITS